MKTERPEKVDPKVLIGMDTGEKKYYVDENKAILYALGIGLSQSMSIITQTHWTQLNSSIPTNSKKILQVSLALCSFSKHDSSHWLSRWVAIFAEMP